MTMHDRAGRLVCVALAAFSWGCTPGEPPGLAQRYAREPLYFQVDAEGPAQTVLERLVTMSRLFGYPPVEERAQAVYVIAGTLEVSARESVVLMEEEVEHQYAVNATLRLEDASGALREEFKLEEYVLGAADRDRALETAVRAGSQKLGQFVFYDGEVLGDAEVRALCADLLVEPSEPGPLYNDTIEKLVALGYRAVPYLIWKLNDSRTVALPGDLPGLTETDASGVRIYHVANYALERILARRTALAIDSDRAYVRRLRQAWQLEWQGRCAGYLKGGELARFLRARAGG